VANHPIQRFIGVISPDGAEEEAVNLGQLPRAILDRFNEVQRLEPGVALDDGQVLRIYKVLGWDTPEPFGEHRDRLFAEPDPADPIFPLLEEFFRSHLDRINEKVPLVRYKIKEGGFRRLQEASSRTRYAKSMASLVLFLLRCLDDAGPVHLSLDLEETLVNLSESFEIFAIPQGAANEEIVQVHARNAELLASRPARLLAVLEALLLTRLGSSWKEDAVLMYFRGHGQKADGTYSSLSDVTHICSESRIRSKCLLRMPIPRGLPPRWG
jgi:hypothetical protein